MIRRRLEFSKETMRQAHARSGGVCECWRIPNIPGFIKGGCNQPLGAGNTFYEHCVPANIRHDNSLDNCAVLTKTCWRIKTSAYDLPTVAKVKRNHDSHIGIPEADRATDGRLS